MKLSENKQTFSFRKLTVGLASVTLATTFLAYHSSAQVKAAETTTESVSDSSENQDATRNATGINQTVSNPATADSNTANANADALSDKTETSLNNNSTNAINSEAANKANLEASREESKDRPFVAMLAANAKAETVTRPKITPESAPEVISPKITSDLASEDSGSSADVDGKTVNPSDPRPWKQTKSGQDTINIHWVFADNSVTSSNASLVVDPDLGGQKVRDDAKIVYQKYELTRKEPELSASVNVGDIDFGEADKFAPVLAYGLRAPNEHISDVTYSGSEVSAGSGSILIRNDLASEGTTADPIPHIDLASPTDSFYQEGNIKGIPVPKISRNGHTYVAGSITVTGSPLHTNLGDYKLNVSLPLSSEYSGDNNYDITVYYFRDIKDDPIDVKVKYLDSDDGNRVVQEKTISGKVGEQVAVPTDIPENYEYQNKDSVPTEITINESLRNNSTPLEIHLVHVKKEVQVAKDISRTIVGIDPKTNAEFEITKQTAHFTGHIVKDMVTGKTTDPEWDQSPIMLAKVTPTAIPGYNPDTAEVGSYAVNPAMESFKVTVHYTANNGTQTIIYRDQTDGDVGKQTINGKTDQTVDVTPKIPDGYVVKGEMPSTVTIKDKDTPIIVTVEHGMTHVDYDHPVDKGTPIPGTEGKLFPAGLTRDDLNKTVTRTVNIIDPHTQKVATTTQEVTFTRGATVDNVTGEITYDNWSENGKHIFDKVDVPDVPGYVASGNVPSLAVTPDSQSTTVTVTYNANEQSITVSVRYIDESDSNKEVAKEDLTGLTNKQKSINYTIPDGYDLVEGQNLPNTYTFKTDNNADVIVKLKHKLIDVSDTDPNAKITRTYKIVEQMPRPKDDPVKYGNDQERLNWTVVVKRKATKDLVTGKTTYGQWYLNAVDNSLISSPYFKIADIPGYSIDLSINTNSDNTDDTISNSNDFVNGDTNIGTYSLATQGSYGSYSNPFWRQGNAENHLLFGFFMRDDWKQDNELDKKLTPSQTIYIYHIALDQNVEIQYQDPDGDVISKQIVPCKTDETVKVTPEIPDGWVAKDKVPGEIIIKPNNEPIAVTVEHSKTYVSHNNPKDLGAPIEGTKDKHYPSGLTHDDLNKTVTREVFITDPSGSKVMTTQTVTFTRDAMVDNVTGEVTYDPWSENGKHIFDKVDVPYITGYRASEEVPEVTVTPDSKSTTVNVTYVAKTYDVYVFYINGTSIYDRKDFDKHANGELGIAKPEVLRGHYGESINIPIKQIPGYYVNPYGHYSNYKFGIDNVTGQELSWYDFSPTGDKDLKDPLSEDASDLDKEYSMPRYIPVVYIKDDADEGYNTRSYNIGYIDTEGAVIGRPTALRGISGTDTNFVAPTFEGYILTNPQDVPAKFGKRSQDIFLVYKPQDVKVTYHYVDEAGKGLSPSVVENNHFTGLINIDKNVKQIDGYRLVSTPKERVVNGLKDLDLSFVYAAKDGTQTIIYQDEGGSEVGKQVIPGKTDETVKVTPEVPAGYVIKTEIPKEVTIKPKDEPITITVTHKVITINHDNPVDEDQPIPGESGQKYPAGLSKDDLNKTIVREIEIDFPSGKKSITTQSVTFTRDATLDLATGKVAYKPWSENGKHTFAKVEAPEIKGYVATSEAPSIVVTPESPICTKVQIDYKAVKGSKVTPGTGTTNETVNVPEPNVPEEWHIAGNLPGKAVIQPEGKSVTVTVGHNMVRVTRNKTVKFDNRIPTESSSKFPSGSDYGKLNRVITQVARPTAVTASSVMDVAQASHTPQMQTQVAQLPQTGAEDGSAIVALDLVLISLSAIGFAARKHG